MEPTITFDNLDPIRVRDGTSTTHSDMGDVQVDGKQYRFHAVRYIDRHPSNMKFAQVHVALFQRGRTIPEAQLTVVRGRIAAEFRNRIRAWAAAL